MYAFSTENFKRTETEVTGLMSLFEEKLLELKEQLPKAKENKINIRVVGETDRLPIHIQKIVDDIHNANVKEAECTLNVCMAYTSRQEMVSALEKSTKTETTFVLMRNRESLCFNVKN